MGEISYSIADLGGEVRDFSVQRVVSSAMARRCREMQFLEDPEINY